MQTLLPRAYINVTPMIDLMLVLLILFMMANLLAPDIALPFSKNAVNPPQPDAVVLRIYPSGKLELSIEDEFGAGGWRVTPAELGPQLERLYAHRPHNRVLYLKADRSLAFGVIDQALSIARRAGVRVVATVTERRGR